MDQERTFLSPHNYLSFPVKSSFQLRKQDKTRQKCKEHTIWNDSILPNKHL